MAFDLLAPFTGSAYTDAANNIQNYLKGTTALGTGTVGTNLAGSLADLQAGQAGALGAITGGVNTARGDISAATPQALAALYGGQIAGVGALTGAQPAALADLSGGVGAATDAYNRLLANTGSADPSTAIALKNALGIGPGPSGYTSSPGYEFALDQARKTALAGANAAGMAPGGNTLDALTKLGVGYANQDYQNYINNLLARAGQEASTGATAASGIGNAALTGGTGAANIRTGTAGKLSDLYSGTGTTAGSTIAGAGNTLAQLAAQGGLAQANVYGTTAAQKAAQRAGATGQTLDLLKGTFAPYSTSELSQAQAETQGPLNLFNLALNTGKLAAGLPGTGGAPTLY